jgi:hypothetical protein
MGPIGLIAPPPFRLATPEGHDAGRGGQNRPPIRKSPQDMVRLHPPARATGPRAVVRHSPFGHQAAEQCLNMCGAALPHGCRCRTGAYAEPSLSAHGAGTPGAQSGDAGAEATGNGIDALARCARGLESDPVAPTAELSLNRSNRTAESQIHRRKPVKRHGHSHAGSALLR